MKESFEMNLVSRAVLLSLLVASAALGAEETGLFCPLVIEPNPGLTESPEALQKRFNSVAREKSGYALLLRKEAEDAVKAAKVTDYASSDVSLGKVAAAGKVENAGYVSLRLTEKNQLMLQGRVVRADGKLIKASMLSTPVGDKPLLDALAFATERFFDQLNGKTPAPVPGEKPVQEVAATKQIEVVKPVEMMNPGTPLRILGIVLGSAGIATTVAGAVVFAGAPVIHQDGDRNVLAQDAAHVAEARAAQGLGLGLITAGAALGITGIVMTIAAPTAPVTAAVAPRADGAVFVVEGSF